MMPYERFRAWQACDQLVLAVYRATTGFPRHELYGLTSQARRAAFSAAANIVEGSAKHGRREFRRYLDIALGSLAELSYTLQLSRKLGLLSDTQWRELDRLRVDASRLTWALYEAVRGKHIATGPRTASATRCRAIAYAAVRNVTPFDFARSRTPTYALVIVAWSSRFTCSCVQRYCCRFCDHS